MNLSDNENMQRTSDDKQALRKSLRQQRNDLSSTLQQEKSASIVLHISHSSAYVSAKHIAVYSPVQGEADPLPLAQLRSFAANNNKQFYLPILQGDNESLLFAPFSSESEFSENRFSIPEPVCNKDELITGDALDLVLMPLLGFDKQGNRLGMGGGFYDRTFEFLKKKTRKPLLIGVAYSFQEVASLKAEYWDVPLNYIATESHFISVRRA